MNRSITRVAAVVAAIAGLAVAASTASAVVATVRVEGPSSTIVPQVTRATAARSITDTMGVAHPLPASPATLVADAAEADGVSYTCAWFGDCLFDFGPLPSGQFWAFIDNDLVASVGAGQAPLQNGDRIAFVPWDFTSPIHMLELAVSGDKLADGSSFTATVLNYDLQTGVATAAAGASVSYGSTVSTADLQGKASFVATGIGPQTVLATSPTAIRSGGLAVCAYAADPTVCDLPAPPPPVTAKPTPGTIDTVPPASRIVAPAPFSRVRTVRRLAGLVAPDRSDVASVQFALARRLGTLCRFLRTATGAFGPAAPCSSPMWLPARGGAFWTAALHRRLAPGRYRAFSRATDGAGNVESRLVTGSSMISFTVVR
jgi:hypothetical protein